MKPSPTSTSLQTPNSKGFTLVELLVTVTIIIVIAAISLTAFTKWTRESKLAASVMKTRELGALVMTYASDNGELPVWHDYTKGKYWWELIMDNESMTDTEFFKSPGHKEFDRKNPAQTLSYGWNYPVIGRHKGDGSFKEDHVLRMTNLPSPEHTLVLADGPALNCWGYINGEANKPDPNRYGGKAAAVFLDGSSRVMRTPEDFLPDSKWFKPVKEMLPK